MFDTEKFLGDYSIPFITKGKNVGSGWKNIQCPFCNDISQHGGFSPEGKYSCWRCGGHSIIAVIAELLQVSFYRAEEITKEYTEQTRKTIIKKQEEKKNTALSLPAECGRLQEEHWNYLLKRNFDPLRLEKEFKLKGTNHLGEYKFRVIAPILLDGKLVSYQGRDISGKQTKYKACKKTDEVVHHKHIVYNSDSVKETMVICEGITDVWRLGTGAVATFGIGWTQQQSIFIAKKKPQKVFIMYDGEPLAQEKANKLGWQLSSLQVKTQVICLTEGDPGDMSQEDANYLMKDIRGHT